MSEADSEALINRFDQDYFTDSANSSHTKPKMPVSQNNVPYDGQQAINVIMSAQ